MEATPGDSGEQGQSKGLFLPRELSASWCFVLFCLLVFDILIASSSMTTRSPGLHCPAPPGPARPRQATAAAPRSRSFLCCAHRAGCDAASFCLGNGMCLSNVCSGVLQVEGDGQPESPRSPSATPLPSSADLGEEVRARRALPWNCPPPGGHARLWRACASCPCVAEGGRRTRLCTLASAPAAATSAQAPRASLEGAPSTPAACEAPTPSSGASGAACHRGEASLRAVLCGRDSKSTLCK